MANLKAVHRELFRRADDECFGSLEELIQHCRMQRDASSELWHPPGLLLPQVHGDRVHCNVKRHRGDRTSRDQRAQSDDRVSDQRAANGHAAALCEAEIVCAGHKQAPSRGLTAEVVARHRPQAVATTD